ncbi:MAG: hypothetical protein ABR568_20185 [Pyrinomonadaceae bacterium]
MKIKHSFKSPLSKRAKKGFRGYPVATIAFYGPTAQQATKVAVGIVMREGFEPEFLERWYGKEQGSAYRRGGRSSNKCFSARASGAVSVYGGSYYRLSA